MKFDVISIIYIAILVAFVISGIKKGLFKTLVALIKSILSFVLSIFLAKPLALLLSNSFVGKKITGKLTEAFLEKGDIFAIEITEANASEIIKMTTEKMSLPETLNEFLVNQLTKLFNLQEMTGMSVAEAFAPTITQYILLVVSFIIIFIIVMIVCSLLKSIFALLEQIPVIKVTNKLAGGVLGFFGGLLIVYLISFGLTFVISLHNDISDVLIKTMCLNTDTFTFSKFIYNENLLLKIIAFIQNLFVK